MALAPPRNCVTSGKSVEKTCVCVCMCVRVHALACGGHAGLGEAAPGPLHRPGSRCAWGQTGSRATTVRAERRWRVRLVRAAGREAQWGHCCSVAGLALADPDDGPGTFREALTVFQAWVFPRTWVRGMQALCVRTGRQGALSDA